MKHVMMEVFKAAWTIALEQILTILALEEMPLIQVFALA
jgi:hypothetical protein